jgi:type I restriction enzyme S subunit
MGIESAFGNIPDNWELTTLGEVCERGNGVIQTGPFGSQLHSSDYVPFGIPTIMPKNIGDNRVIEEGISRVSEKDAQRLSRYRVRYGDIIYSRRGDVRRRALIRKEQSGWLCGTGSLMVRFGNAPVDAIYASYFLGHPLIQDWIEQHAIGATMPNLNTSIMAVVPFVLPPLSEQKAIAEILGTLDDKIELNRRMNQTLEALARTIFKSWFVDFNPVRAKMDGHQPVGIGAETAALFPESFEKSRFGEIPCGWKWGIIGDIAKNHRRSIKPEDVDPETPYIGLEHMPRNSIAIDGWGKAADVVSDKFQYKKGEILFGKLRPYFHKVVVAVSEGVCSTDVLVVNTKKEENYGLLLGHLSSTEFINYVDAGSSGTKMPRTNWNYMSRYEIAIPPIELSHEYTILIKPIIANITTNIEESSILGALRDTLLPRLMSGAVSINISGS